MAEGCLASITDLIPSSDVAPTKFDTNIDASRICFDGYTFWILTPYKSGKQETVGEGATGRIEYSDLVRFQNPPGNTMLTGDSAVYGGLTTTDMIVSSYYAWTNNSCMNPAPKPLASDIAAAGAVAWNQSVRYPGFFNYPVCNGLDDLVAAAQSFWDEEYITPC